MKDNLWKGTGVALVTPFDERDRIDFESLGKLLEHVEKGGADYLVILGTTSEAPVLSSEEKKLVREYVIRHNDSRLPVMLGLGGNDTSAMEEHLRSDNFEGIDAVLSVTPYYNRPTQRGIVAHFNRLADASPVPFVLYNVPARTGSNISFESTLELAAHPNIIGIKEASCDMNQCARIAAAKPDDFLLIAGDDMHAMPIMSFGGAGVISVIGNALPAEVSKAMRDFMDGNPQNAIVTFLKMTEMIDLIFEEGNPAGVKALLSEMNLCDAEVRLPLVQASDALRHRISEVFERIRQ